MNIDKSTSAANTILQSAEMSRTASAHQAKSWEASFAEQMKNSAKEQDVEQTEEQEKTSEAEKNSQTKNNSKTISKKSSTNTLHNSSQEESLQSQQTLEGEIPNNNENSAYQNSQQQGQNGQNQQQSSYNSLSDQIQAYMSANGVSVNFSNFNAMGATSRSQLTGMAASVDYSAIQMSDGEAKFFSDLVSRTDMSAGSVANEFEKMLQQADTQTVQSTAKSTLALIEALKESSKTNQPFRIDFDKEISVVLQVDKEGKINANFIPGDKAVENYLKNNIGFLRQRFDEENIAYGDLNYSKRRSKDEQEKRNNKENAHE